jgi:hypothetical protein
VLPDLIANYNNTVHSFLKVTPEQALKNNPHYVSQLDKKYTLARKATYNTTIINVGDKVRLLKSKALFQKGGAEFTKTVHTITRIEHGLYYVPDRLRGYRIDELQKVGEVHTAPEATTVRGLDARAEREVNTRARKEKRDLSKEGVTPELILTGRAGLRERVPSHQLISSKGERVFY